KLPDSMEKQIEAEIDAEMVTVPSEQLGRVDRVEDAAGRYIEFCKSTAPYWLDLKGVKIVVDCANGATYHIAPNVFDELGATVIRMAAQPDGLNINDACGATAPENLAAAVLEHGADLGIALDGDGDRLIMVDDRGEVLDGDELLFIIAEGRRAERRLEGGVVGTVMTNLGLEEALRARDIPLKRASVGDRYVLELMKETGWALGGETSGHIICLDRMSTGDGIVAALQVLITAVISKKPIHELKGGMSKYPQVIQNVRMPARVDVTALPLVQAAVRDVEQTLGESGRVLLRLSGTEPLVRVMVEGREEAQVTELATQISETVQTALNGTC
ncbi:MAG: phosphoglucosamine mutase, partial [Gammaproteobacteria bacterium]|nr:phosphoglucosamine mutase [Gammaproteobacteria bacterium]